MPPHGWNIGKPMQFHPFGGLFKLARIACHRARLQPAKLWNGCPPSPSPPDVMNSAFLTPCPLERVKFSAA